MSEKASDFIGALIWTAATAGGYLLLAEWMNRKGPGLVGGFIVLLLIANYSVAKAKRALRVSEAGRRKAVASKTRIIRGVPPEMKMPEGVEE